MGDTVRQRLVPFPFPSSLAPPGLTAPTTVGRDDWVSRWRTTNLLPKEARDQAMGLKACTL